MHPRLLVGRQVGTEEATKMTSDVRRHWRSVTVSLLIWGGAAVLAPAATADQGDPPPQGAATGAEVAEAATPAEVAALRARVEAAETQIELLKSVVVQALRAQSAAETALRREREAQDATKSAAGSADLMLADHLEALTDNLESLREEIAALRAQREADAPEPAAGVPSDPADAVAEGEAEPSVDADEFSDSGVGGAYIPLIEDDSAAFATDDDADPVDARIKVAEVHFDSGSADLTPGGRRNALEALERIKAMAPAKVRVVGYADTVGDAGYNRHLSAQRARSIAAVLDQGGLSNGEVEIVGNGEDGLPEPTPDGVSEPLNRCAGIFVVMDSPK
jgi:outer membrane protein OmpA-like peptidoglycan-associated protein